MANKKKKLNKKTPNKLGKRYDTRNGGKKKVVSQPTTTRNWLELPPELMVDILSRVGVIDIIFNVQKVCTAWYKLCKDHPAMWRVIFMDYDYIRTLFPWLTREALEKMSKDAIDKSQGQLVEITLVEIWDEKLLHYAADRSSQLKRLEIGFFNIKGILIQLLKKLPLLEEFSVYKADIPIDTIATLGSYCPMLKTLKLNATYPAVDDEVAKAIGGSLPELQHLELTWSFVSNTGLQAILDGCPHLQSLDLRMSQPVDLEGEQGKRCARQIKCLQRPNDPINKFRYGEWDEDKYITLEELMNPF